MATTRTTTGICVSRAAPSNIRWRSIPTKETSLTRKDFELLARVFKATLAHTQPEEQVALRTSIRVLAEEIADREPAFIKEKFLRASGIEGD